MYQIEKNAVLLIIGGAVYFFIEIAYRGYSHWTMALIGGVMFLLIGGINEFYTWDMPLTLQGLIGALAITEVELVAGIILNCWLGLGIWDYTDVPLNFMGQICLPFSVAWFFLAIAAVILDDYLRWKFFKEEKPHYSLF